MAIKKAVKATKAKKTVKKAQAKKVVKAKKVAAKTAGKSSPAKKAVKKGSKYVCGKCGLVVSVDTVCGCVRTCDLMCCGKQMRAK